MSKPVRNKMRYGDDNVTVWTGEEPGWQVDRLSWVMWLVNPDGEPVLAADREIAAQIGQLLIETAGEMGDD